MVLVLQIIRELIAQKKPLVGHNCLLDLLHLFEHFVRPLPPKYEVFKRELHSLLPCVVDTKHLAVVLKPVRWARTHTLYMYSCLRVYALSPRSFEELVH